LAEKLIDQEALRKSEEID
jgi:5'-3' exoribonuclease 2